MKDIELPPLSKFDHPEPRTMQWSDLELYAIKSYARAAVEDDRDQRVPDGWKLVPVEPTEEMLCAGDDVLREAFRDRCIATRTIYDAMLASTPAPAQQEPAKPMDAHRAAYFMRRFLHEEKMLGPNEQAALHFTISALEAMESAAQHQEPPQPVERKPMTDAEMPSENEARLSPDPYCSFVNGIRFAERHHGIKE